MTPKSYARHAMGFQLLRNDAARDGRDDSNDAAMLLRDVAFI
jgi:hypothetical protein